MRDGGVEDLKVVTYNALEKSQNNKPPLGLKPKFIHDEERRDNIKASVSRYLEYGKKIPVEWIEEYNLLT